MGLFHKDLEKEIEQIIESLNQKAFKLPKNWHWLKSEAEPKLDEIERIDYELIKKIKELHEKGKDIPYLSSKILTLCSELHRYLYLIKQEKKLNENSKEYRRIFELLKELRGIYQNQHEILSKGKQKLIYSNKLILRKKDEIIYLLNKEPINWHTIQRALFGILTTRSIWNEIIEKEDVYTLTTNGGKFQEHDESYKKILIKLVYAINKEGMEAILEDWLFIKPTGDYYKNKTSGYSLKKYVTIKYESVWNMLQNLIPLAKDLKNITQRTGVRIQLKVPRTFLNFLYQQDSIVIHYDDNKVEKEINDAVDRWQKKYNIKSERREYAKTEHARDYFDTSFSDNIAYTAVYVMSHPKIQMSNEELAILGINYALTLGQMKMD